MKPETKGALAGAVIAVILMVAARHARAEVTFNFPDNPGSLTIEASNCENAMVRGLYGSDVPILHAGRVVLPDGARHTGCWYAADGHVFFTDDEGDLLLPPIPVEWFLPGMAPTRTIPGSPAKGFGT